MQKARGSAVLRSVLKKKNNTKAHMPTYFGNMMVLVSGGHSGRLGLRGRRDMFFLHSAGLHRLSLKPYTCRTFFFFF